MKENLKSFVELTLLQQQRRERLEKLVAEMNTINDTLRTTNTQLLNITSKLNDIELPVIVKFNTISYLVYNNADGEIVVKKSADVSSFE